MAKAKPGIDPASLLPQDRRGQVRLMCRYMETYTEHRVECFVCNKADSTEDKTEAGYARELHAEGWRWTVSEKFGTVGFMCPECVRTPDAKRGGDDDG
jgi:hypothetical protein